MPRSLRRILRPTRQTTSRRTRRRLRPWREGRRAIHFIKCHSSRVRCCLQSSTGEVGATMGAEICFLLQSFGMKLAAQCVRYSMQSVRFRALQSFGLKLITSQTKPHQNSPIQTRPNQTDSKPNFQNQPLSRTYPVDILFSQQPVPDYVRATVETIMRIHGNEPAGDILAFLTGQEEVRPLSFISGCPSQFVPQSFWVVSRVWLCFCMGFYPKNLV
jgi:hypothetical protein